MSAKLDVNQNLQLDRVESTSNNIVIKFNTASVKRVRNLTLEDATKKYNDILSKMDGSAKAHT